MIGRSVLTKRGKIFTRGESGNKGAAANCNRDSSLNNAAQYNVLINSEQCNIFNSTETSQYHPEIRISLISKVDPPYC